MRKSDLPPEIANAIEFTTEFRQAMGIVEDEPPPYAVKEVPKEEELEQIPEWYAVNGWITAGEYLACFGYPLQQVQTIKHQGAGKKRLPRKSRNATV